MDKYSKDNQWETCKHAVVLRMQNHSSKDGKKEITGNGCKMADNNWIGGPKCFKESCADYTKKKE
jgi:hypothetical protein